MRRQLREHLRWTRALLIAALVGGGAFSTGHVTDASEYNRLTEISRAYQAMPQSAADWPRGELLIISDPYQLAVAGTWLEQPLVVQGTPGSAVTFQALDSGRFGNGRSRMTVRADGRGVAAVRFFAARPGEYRVLASAPDMVIPAHFDIRAVTRQVRDDVVSGRYAQRYVATQGAAAKRRADAAAATDLGVSRKGPPIHE